MVPYRSCEEHKAFFVQFLAYEYESYYPLPLICFVVANVADSVAYRALMCLVKDERARSRNFELPSS